MDVASVAKSRKWMVKKHLEKAGWPKYQKMKYPFLVDTNIFVQHIDQNGRMFPIAIPKMFKPENWDKKKKQDFIHIGDYRQWKD